MNARPATTPNYYSLPDAEFERRVEALRSRYADCDLCASQYRPHYKARTEERYEDISRGITPEEYAAVLDHARDVGLERLEYDPRMAARAGI